MRRKIEVTSSTIEHVTCQRSDASHVSLLACLLLAFTQNSVWHPHNPHGLLVQIWIKPETKWSFSSFLTKRYNSVSSGGLWSALRMHSKNEEHRRNVLLPPSPKWPVERLHKDVVSFRQKTTERPNG